MQSLIEMREGGVHPADGRGEQPQQAVSIVGYDNTYLAALHHVSMTTVNRSSPEMGARAFDVLLERVEEGRSTPVHARVTPTLVVRSTTGPPR